MPLFGGHNRSQSSTTGGQNNAPGAASGLFQATQTLGSIGAPQGNLRTATTGTTSAGTDALYLGSSRDSSHSGAQPPRTPNYGQGTPRASTNASMISPSAIDSRKHTQGYGRPSDELHLGDTSAPPSRGISRDSYLPAPPRISVEQSTPEHYGSKSNLPGTLQTGGAGRPLLSSANTAPTVPTLGNSMSQDPFATPLRSQTESLQHNRSYSRGSPGTGHDGTSYQAYNAGTPGGSEAAPQFSTPSSSLKYVPGQQRNVSNTPLGLADIRPRADSNLAEGLPGANPYSYDGATSQPTNSNYLAPWAIYAFDWCKWPAHNNDAGKVAVGSYLEDGHNFVSSIEG